MSIFLGKLVAKSRLAQKYRETNSDSVYVYCTIYPQKRALLSHISNGEEEGVKSRTHIDSGYKMIFKKLYPYFLV